MEERERTYAIYVGYFVNFVNIDGILNDVEVSEAQVRELLEFDRAKLAELDKHGWIALCEYDKDGDGFDYGVYLRSRKMA